MSTTSTSYSRHRKRQSRRREGEIRQGHPEERSSVELTRSRDYYRDRSRETQSENGKWSSDKLKHELSSFIAEFSYLTDTSNKTQNHDAAPKNQSQANTPQPNFHVYSAREQTINTPFDNPDVRKRGVEWEDQQRNVLAYNVQGPEYYEEPPRTKVKKRGLFRRALKLRARKSRSARSCTSRDLSCQPRRSKCRKVRRRFSKFRASKSRSRCSREVRSRSLMPLRRRVRSRTRCRRRPQSSSCSRSRVKHIPLRSCRGKSREIVIKRSIPKAVYKTIEPCEDPTLVTLYPRTIRRRRVVSISRRPELKLEPAVSAPELPCKCAQCTNKYRSLARLCQIPCFDPCAPQCLPMQCIPAPCVPTCPPTLCALKCQPVPTNCNPCTPNWCCNTGCGMCSRPCANQCCTGDCCQPCCQPIADRCFKSVCFKFGSVDQSLNSNITHYFHSILDKRVCC